MHSSRSILLSAIEQARRALEAADTDKYNDDYLVRNMLQGSYSYCLTELNLSASDPVIAKTLITIRAGVSMYTMPSNCGSVVRLIRYDDAGKIMFDWRPNNLMHPLGAGWRLNGNVLLLDPTPSETAQDTVWELWYIPAGDCLVHYATDGEAGATETEALVLTGVAWTASNKTITKAGAFAGVEMTTGLCIEVDGGTGVTTGWFPIREIVDDDSAVLFGSIKVTDIADVTTARLGLANKLTMSASPFVGLVDTRPGAYVGCFLRALIVSSGKTQEERIISDYDAETGEVTVHLPFAGSSVPSPLGEMAYEVMFPGHRTLMDMMGAHTALEMGEDRSVPAGKLQSLDMKYRRTKKAAFDRVAGAQSRTGHYYARYTVDNPDVGPDYWRGGLSTT